MGNLLAAFAARSGPTGSTSSWPTSTPTGRCSAAASAKSPSGWNTPVAGRLPADATTSPWATSIPRDGSPDGRARALSGSLLQLDSGETERRKSSDHRGVAGHARHDPGGAVARGSTTGRPARDARRSDRAVRHRWRRLAPRPRRDRRHDPGNRRPRPRGPPECARRPARIRPDRRRRGRVADRRGRRARSARPVQAYERMAHGVDPDPACWPRSTRS